MHFLTTLTGKDGRSNIYTTRYDIYSGLAILLVWPKSGRALSRMVYSFGTNMRAQIYESWTSPVGRCIDVGDHHKPKSYMHMCRKTWIRGSQKNICSRESDSQTCEASICIVFSIKKNMMMMMMIIITSQFYIYLLHNFV